MAVKTSLRIIAKTIAKAVREYATRRGMPPDDYILLGTHDENTDRIRLTFGTTQKIDELEWYSGLLEEIRLAFPDFPHIVLYVGIVIKVVDNLNDLYGYSSLNGDEMTDLSEYFERI